MPAQTGGRTIERQAYWIGLRKIPGLGPKRFRILLEYFGSAEAIWKARPEEIAQVSGLGEKVRQGLIDMRPQIDLEQEMERLRKLQVSVLTLEDPDYPGNLKNIYDPPPVLWMKGRVETGDNKAIAIVGSRRATPYGRMVTEKLARQLAQAGICVVSGMARGIDTWAHQAALTGGRTIAVLGSGIDVIYPRENAQLYQKIAAQGAVMSEFPPGTPPEAANFPARNRIISGMVVGVVVVEAANDGGALITANMALEQGRDVFAVPGPVSSKYSQGTNRLIKEGAILVEGVEDILDEYGWKTTGIGQNINPLPAEDKSNGDKLNNLQNLLLRHLIDKPLSPGELAELTGSNTAEAASNLLLMELKGLVRRGAGGRYYRSGKF